MAIAVTPCFVDVTFATLEKTEGIWQTLVHLSSLTIEIEQILAGGDNKPVGTATSGATHVGRGIAHGIGGAICHVDGGAVAGTHYHLGTTIFIPVISHNVLLVVLEVTHIGAAVNPP